MSTLVKADAVHSFTGSAADVLKEYPNSPYTAFLVTTQDQVQCYAQHCARLSEGLGALVTEDSLNRSAIVHVGDGTMDDDHASCGEAASNTCLLPG